MDVSGVDDCGIARLCVLGASIRVPSLWLPIELKTSRLGDLETLPEDGDSLCGALNTLSDRERLGGVQRRASRSRAGALIDGCEDLPENGLERIAAGGLLGVKDGREGAVEGGALGVNDGREGATERGALGVNDGREGAIERGALGVKEGLEGAVAGGLNDGLEDDMEGDLPALDGALGVDLMAWRCAPMLLRAALRSEPPRAAITLGVAGSKPASEKPAWYVSEAPLPLCVCRPNLDCARRELEDPIKRAAVSTTDATAVLRSFFSLATNMVVSFPSPTAQDSRAPSAAGAPDG
jgi:hypothetical protein